MGWSVYIHISPSNKYYVGITSKTPEERWRNGFGYYTQSYFYNAIQKYGWDNFQHEIIAENLSGEEAKKFEIKLIKILNRWSVSKCCQHKRKTAGGYIWEYYSNYIK